MRVAAVLMEILRRSGVRHLFGNPGTTELTFLDALPDSGLEYVVALQEATAVAAADGYAQASGQVGVVNVHVAPGVANGLSILHNAARSKSPLLLTAGQQDTRFLLHDPILSGDLVQLTEQFTKWSYEVRRADDAPSALRRALTLARTPPTGPVFLSLPMDLMADVVDDGGEAAPFVDSLTRPSAAALQRAVDLLAAARSPLIIAGDGIARAGAVAELVKLAELLGARVHGEPIFRRLAFPGDHALWRGGLFPAPSAIRRAVDGCDAVLIVGATVFTWLLYSPGEPFPRGLPIVQIDDDPREIGRSHAPTVGILADPRTALAELTEALAARQTAGTREAAAARLREIAEARSRQVQRVNAAADAECLRVPISPAHLMSTLAAVAPRDVAVVDESATSLPYVLRYLPFATPGSFFGGKTGTLGWGMGAALGVQLAFPGRTVVATIGDGSVMYSPQALWTAARYRLPVKFVVPNNASYAILKSGMLTLGLESAKRDIYPGMDLVGPEIDYVGLARALGVRAERVDKPDVLGDVLRACLEHPGPALVDVAIDRGFKPI
jgi:benzoylformate decarboxylase